MFNPEEHTRNMEEKYHKEIWDSIERTVLIGIGDYTIDRKYDTKIEVLKCIAEDVITDNCVVLNFASYVNAGGGFINGSLAQEESLCRSSFLYNVLSSDRCNGLFYSKHINNTNNGVHSSEMLLSPDIIFTSGIKCNVLTCAAVDKRVASRYISDSDCDNFMINRVHDVCAVLRRYDFDRVVLGAYGCGVFRNDPYVVARAFKDYLKGVVKEAIFAVPDNRLYDIFKEVLI